jgi:hypothetical protein
MPIVQLNVRVQQADADRLKVAAKAYRAPSLNWFAGELIGAMLNPARWDDFQRRLATGQEQMTLAIAEAQKRPTKPALEVVEQPPVNGTSAQRWAYIRREVTRLKRLEKRQNTPVKGDSGALEGKKGVRRGGTA